MTGTVDLWTTAVSRPTPAGLIVRDYSLNDLIGVASFAELCHLLLRGSLPTAGQARVLDAVLTCVPDNGLAKPGTAAARYVAADGGSVTAAIAAAALAVGTSTGDPGPAARGFAAGYDEWRRSGTDLASFARGWVDAKRAARRRIAGFGRPAGLGPDPRVTRVREVAIEEGVWAERGAWLDAVAAAVEAGSTAPVPLNDMGVAAMVLTELGFTPDEITGLMVIATLPGIVAHATEASRVAAPGAVLTAEFLDVEG